MFHLLNNGSEYLVNNGSEYSDSRKCIQFTVQVYDYFINLEVTQYKFTIFSFSINNIILNAPCAIASEK